MRWILEELKHPEYESLSACIVLELAKAPAERPYQGQITQMLLHMPYRIIDRVDSEGAALIEEVVELWLTHVVFLLLVGWQTGQQLIKDVKVSLAGIRVDHTRLLEQVVLNVAANWIATEIEDDLEILSEAR